MKIRTSSAFTLIEMLTVMAVIAILASLVVSVNAFAHKKAALARTEGEIKTMIAACESYKGDFGDYPRDAEGEEAAEKLDPRLDGDPTKGRYQKASLVLYKALSGDAEANGKGKEKSYCEFRPDQLQKVGGGTGTATGAGASAAILCLRDPFGNSYGYSTAAADAERKYRDELKKNPSAPRPTGAAAKGFSPTFDLWSTGGVITTTKDPETLNNDRKRWVKNW